MWYDTQGGTLRSGEGHAEGARLRAFRKAMDWKPFDVAQRMNELVGETVVDAAHVRGWEGGTRTFTRYKAAVVAMLYEPNPRACLEFLLGRAPGVPGLQVDLPATGPLPPASGKMQVQVAPGRGAAHARKRRRTANDG